MITQYYHGHMIIITHNDVTTQLSTNQLSYFYHKSSDTF